MRSRGGRRIIASQIFAVAAPPHALRHCANSGGATLSAAVVRSASAAVPAGDATLRSTALTRRHWPLGAPRAGSFKRATEELTAAKASVSRNSSCAAPSRRHACAADTLFLFLFLFLFFLFCFPPPLPPASGGG